MVKENIYIGKQIPNPCQKCRKEVCENGCKKYDKYYDDFQKSKTYLYSRTEAIKKMETAMKQYAQDKEIYTDKELATVALDALLGDK